MFCEQLGDSSILGLEYSQSPSDNLSIYPDESMGYVTDLVRFAARIPDEVTTIVWGVLETSEATFRLLESQVAEQ